MSNYVIFRVGVAWNQTQFRLPVLIIENANGKNHAKREASTVSLAGDQYLQARPVDEVQRFHVDHLRRIGAVKDAAFSLKEVT